MRISFIIPSRNNLKYLQQAVQSITDCYGNNTISFYWMMHLLTEHGIGFNL
jgi:glycosyltransferase involved in cell wall biosynthesis